MEIGCLSQAALRAVVLPFETSECPEIVKESLVQVEAAQEKKSDLALYG